MNILFLTITRIDSIEERGIYTDLMRNFRDEGHQLYIVTPTERHLKQPTHLKEVNGVHILKVWTLNQQKCNLIEKGLGMLWLEKQFIHAIKKHYSKVKFDLVIYSTPPITLTKAVSYIKKRDGAKTYLLLKDIFPQNAVDLGMMKQNSFLHHRFIHKEKALYAVSDRIGCMSPANVEFVIKHNPEVKAEKVEVCPNSIDIMSENITAEDKKTTRGKYNIPEEAILFIYGGNLGKPQGVDFLLAAIDSNKGKKDRFFAVVGSGTEYTKIKAWFDENKPSNALLLSSLPKQEYNQFVKSGDVGLIFLDPRFTIPNYPSRLLSYLENKIPILAATDGNTDIGKLATENGYGKWCINGELDRFNEWVDFYSKEATKREEMGMKGYEFLKNNYTAQHSYNTIMRIL